MSARGRPDTASAGDALLHPTSVRWDSAAQYVVRGERLEQVEAVRDLLLKERSEDWQSTDNLYPSLILLVYVPQAVSCLPLLDSDHNRRWCSVLLVVTCVLNLLYLLIFLLASRLLYSSIDRRRDGQQMLSFWLVERRTNIAVRVRLLLLVVMLDLALTLVQLCLLWMDRAPLEQDTSPEGLLPFLTTTYVWILASAVSLYKGLQQLWQQLRALVRAARGELMGARHSSATDSYFYKDDGLLLWSEQDGAWLQPELSPDCRVGNCLVRDVQVRMTGRSGGSLHGVLRYEARTEATWSGAYLHFWLQWWSGDAVLCSMDMGEEQGLLPHNVMFRLLFPGSWRTFESHFLIQVEHERAACMRDSELGDQIRFCYAG